MMVIKNDKIIRIVLLNYIDPDIGRPDLIDQDVLFEKRNRILLSITLTFIMACDKKISLRIHSA